MGDQNGLGRYAFCPSCFCGEFFVTTENGTHYFDGFGDYLHGEEEGNEAVGGPYCAECYSEIVSVGSEDDKPKFERLFRSMVEGESRAIDVGDAYTLTAIGALSLAVLGKVEDSVWKLVLSGVDGSELVIKFDPIEMSPKDLFYRALAKHPDDTVKAVIEVCRAGLMGKTDFEKLIEFVPDALLAPL